MYVFHIQLISECYIVLKLNKEDKKNRWNQVLFVQHSGFLVLQSAYKITTDRLLILITVINTNTVSWIIKWKSSKKH